VTYKLVYVLKLKHIGEVTAQFPNVINALRGEGFRIFKTLKKNVIMALKVIPTTGVPKMFPTVAASLD
jgi:hypothetical protein